MIPVIVVAAITGAGLVTGLLFAFSTCVMQALAELPQDKGMFTMNHINEKIINPLFLILFMGTPALCLVIAILSVTRLDDPGSVYLLTGALAYLAGPFGITVRFNVPLNNQLARTDLADAGQVWPMYQQRWQRWNHTRTAIGAVSIALLALGLAYTGS